jgi:hypothetical protein
MTATIVVEATDDTEDVMRRLDSIRAHNSVEVVVICSNRHQMAVESATKHLDPMRMLPLPDNAPESHLSILLESVSTDWIGFLSSGAVYTEPEWSLLGNRPNSLFAWVPDTCLSGFTAEEFPANGRSWCVSRALLEKLPGLGSFRNWSLSLIRQASNSAGVKLNWPSPALVGSDSLSPSSSTSSTLNRQSSVLALIPHYGCEEWLTQCLESLVSQSRRLDGIVVIDDCSPSPPVQNTSEFSNVTLLAAEQNVGPYRLVQQVINDTCYDAYLFQDADDWSTCDRLEILLAEAERTGAELIGSQELRVICDDGTTIPTCYPQDVNDAYSKFEGHPILHPTTLVARKLIERIGGFATALKFGADSEFLRRAIYNARIINVGRYCYYHRHRAGSLATSPETGIGSTTRNELMHELRQWANRNKEEIARGSLRRDEIKPYAVGEPVRLKHLAGPPLAPFACKK